MKIFCLFFLIVIQQSSLVYGEESGETSSNIHKKIERFSRREGYDVAASLKNHSDWIDLPHVIQGIQDYIEGKPPQSILESEGGASYCRILLQLFEQKAKANLEKAHFFLQTLENKPQLHSLENGKVWYEVLAEGKGEACVTKDSTPFLHYSIITLAGEGIVDTHMQCRPYKVPLAETIPGFTKGVERMRVGERRKIYIHPDLGYGKVGYVPPNSLLIVEVEVINL